MAMLVTRIGNLKFDQYLNTRNAIKPFYDRKYLVDESDPALRSAIDTALVKRMRALVHASLSSAVDDREASRTDRGAEGAEDARRRRRRRTSWSTGWPSRRSGS